MVKPTLITWMMSPALVPGTGASNIAWCSLGSKRSPGCGSILWILCFSKALSRSRRVSSMPSISPGAAARTASVDVVERPLEVVVDRQEVAGEAGGAVELGVAAVALGALAGVLGVGERPQQPVLEVGDLGLAAPRARRLGGLGADLLDVLELGLDVVQERLALEIAVCLVLRHVRPS